MTLPTGTALQHGNYVVDAFSAEDAIGPIYLATHIPSGRWVQLRILGSRHPEAIPFPERRARFYDYLGRVQALDHPLFSGHLSGFEEGGVCYQTMAANLGYPLSRVVCPESPAPLRQSIALMRHITQGLLALQSLGYQGITLSPDQFWQSRHDSGLTFIGFDWPQAETEPADRQQARLVKGLSHLLYFLLTGHRADNTKAPLAVDVRNRLPDLPYSLDTALQVGARQDSTQPSILLQDWLELLPTGEDLAERQVEGAHQGPVADPADSSTRSPQATPLSSIPTNILTNPTNLGSKVSQDNTAVAIASTAIVPPRSASRPWAPAALVITAVMASMGGLGLGLTARLQPDPARNSVRLSPEQSFPPLSDWNGDDPIDTWDISPVRRSLPDYGESPARPAVMPNPGSRPGFSAGEEAASSDSDFEQDFLEDDLELTSPATENNFPIDDPSPFIEVPQTESSPPSLPAPVEGDTNAPATPNPPLADPPAPMPKPSEAAAPQQEAPAPLRAPAPLKAPPPSSAPAPSTS